MKDPKLQHSLKSYYDSKSMDSEALDHILEQGDLELARSKSPSANILTRRWDRSVFWVGAAGILVLFMFFIPLSSDIENRVIQEISMNHQKALDVEIETGDYKALNQSMNRLGFTIEAPERLLQSHVLLGARYCSIQGNIAAQLKLRNRHSGDIATLYLTPLTSELKGLMQREFVSDSVRITLWKSTSLFYGLAQGPHL